MQCGFFSVQNLSTNEQKETLLDKYIREGRPDRPEVNQRMVTNTRANKRTDMNAKKKTNQQTRTHEQTNEQTQTYKRTNQRTRTHERTNERTLVRRSERTDNDNIIYIQPTNSVEETEVINSLYLKVRFHSLL